MFIHIEEIIYRLNVTRKKKLFKPREDVFTKQDNYGNEFEIKISDIKKIQESSYFNMIKRYSNYVFFGDTPTCEEIKEHYNSDLLATTLYLINTEDDFVYVTEENYNRIKEASNRAVEVSLHETR